MEVKVTEMDFAPAIGRPQENCTIRAVATFVGPKSLKECPSDHLRPSEFVSGGQMIRQLLLKVRLRSAVAKSRRFMAQYNNSPEQIGLCRSAGSPLSKGPSSAQLKELLKARRARAAFFDAHLFVDPAWDILLTAYVAVLDQERLLISSLLRRSVVPATTMLRWIKALEQEGWLDRSASPLDDPRNFLSLSSAGRAGMEGYLASVWPSLPL